MDARRVSQVVPKVRQVGFVTHSDPNPPPQASRTQSVPIESNSGTPYDSPDFSPVMIPPPRHHSENLSHLRSAAVAVPESSSRRPMWDDRVAVVGSYNPGNSLLGQPVSPNSSEVNSEASTTLGWFGRNSSGKFSAGSSFPGGGFDLTTVKMENFTQLEGKKPEAVPERGGGAAVEVHNEVSSSTAKAKTTKAERRAMQEAQRAAKAATKGKGGGGGVEVNNRESSSNTLKAKTTKAERRETQEAQRAAKAAGKAQGNKPVAAAGGAGPSNILRQPSQNRDDPAVGSTIAGSDRRGGDRPPERERKKDVPPPRMQFDDQGRVNKSKKRAVFNQPEAKNRVELFRHLPQYEHGSQLTDLESKFLELDSMHPAVYKVGVQYLAGDVTGGNARCIAMLRAFQEVINDYSTPPGKTLVRDLTAKISSYVSFLIECRPLSMSMGNAIRFQKSRIAKLPLTLSETEAKAALCNDIDRFINEKIILADKVIVRHAATKVRDGDVLLTYGSSCVVEMILLYAHELGKQFRVVVVDSRPKHEGQALLRRLLAKGLSCTYTHINAVSYIMHEVTRVFLGASSVLSNGTTYSRVGTACVAMVAHAFRVPVLICCEAYKFHERVQLDSICSNELGDSNDIARVPGRPDVNSMDNRTNEKNLQFLNLMYDATPSEYVSMIITDYGMIPPTSVPVIVREYRREYLLI
ncbi:nagb/rpia/coa transferase-like superfamily protein [Citrus sinensis]|uniref:Nagb/rpia/coa transferase-like superfamily protein n=1 Tax=Citrus sinensis TaxID=2711 RepID=A0ACB8LYP4_CITSI|nr:nagb/rpia/coa transferase-like superfamily protein [Citrus sinensis]